MTAYRAPGTSNTNIIVSATVGSPVPGSTVTDAYAACFKMSYAGTVRAQTSSSSNDPTLSVNTIINGAAVAGLYGAGGAASAGAVPVFRSEAHTTYANRNPDTTVDAPVGTVDGDILLAEVLAVRSTTVSGDIVITPPAGWTQIGSNTEGDAGGYKGKLFVYWKRASGEGSSYVFSHIGSAGDLITQIMVSAYSGGIASGDPVDVFSSNSAGTGSTLTATGVTTTSANTKLVLLGHNWDGTGTLTAPTGMTERFDGVVYSADEDWATAGATGNRTQTLASSGPWAGFLVALKPVAGGGGTGALTAWTGLTERYDTETFSVASADIVATSTPLAISADLTPNLSGSTNSVASLSLSFNPIPTGTMAALSGSYVLTGTNATTRRTVAAAPGAYVLTGTPATSSNAQSIAATPGSYALTGTSAGLNPSASAVASIVYDAAAAQLLTASSYTFTQSVAAAGGERLVIVGGLAGADGDFSACTIDGQTGTRVGFVSRGVPIAGGQTPFLTAFRAPGTANPRLTWWRRSAAA